MPAIRASKPTRRCRSSSTNCASAGSSSSPFRNSFSKRTSTARKCATSCPNSSGLADDLVQTQNLERVACKQRYNHVQRGQRGVLAQCGNRFKRRNDKHEKQRGRKRIAI